MWWVLEEMIVFATVSDMTRVGVVLDLETGRARDIPCLPQFFDPTVVGRPQCRPFGITWTPNEFFVVNNRQLLVFDPDFGYLRTESIRLQVNMHQIAYHS